MHGVQLQNKSVRSMIWYPGIFKEIVLREVELNTHYKNCIKFELFCVKNCLKRFFWNQLKAVRGGKGGRLPLKSLGRESRHFKSLNFDIQEKIRKIFLKINKNPKFGKTIPTAPACHAFDIKITSGGIIQLSRRALKNIVSRPWQSINWILKNRLKIISLMIDFVCIITTSVRNFMRV